jgi:hypothetical protein
MNDPEGKAGKHAQQSVSKLFSTRSPRARSPGTGGVVDDTLKSRYPAEPTDTEGLAVCTPDHVVKLRPATSGWLQNRVSDRHFADHRPETVR